jgi:MFS family permease
MNTSMKIVLLVTLVTNIDFSFGVASLWTMVKSVHGEKSDAAAAHTLFAFSRLISTPIFGFLADRAPLRVTLLLGLAAYILSSIQYIATVNEKKLHNFGNKKNYN